jgi:acyl-CoA synthetase (AMP-forming)/AMP-acid ligase II
VGMSILDGPQALLTLGRAGLLRPVNPLHLMDAGKALKRWGVSYAGGIAAAAALHPHDVFVIDDAGALTWSEMDRRSNALAHALGRRGIVSGDLVAVLSRNHRGFIDATAALAKLGADTLYLNTGFAGPQLREVLARERPVAVIYDEEFAELLGDGADVAIQVLSWAGPPPGPTARTTAAKKPASRSTAAAAIPTIDELIGEGPDTPPAASGRVGRTIILTSGTTGTPKGAPREQTSGVNPAVSMLDRIPYRQGEVTLVPAPLFHSWGFGNLTMGLLLNSTFVLHRHCDAEAVLADIQTHRANVLVAVPVMLQRILELPASTRRRYDTSSLRIVPLSGSSIPAGIVTRWMDEFGDNLYNLYGSTEVGWVSIATPADLRHDPRTAGRPPLHTDVRLLDGAGRQVAPGKLGRIFVKSELLFDGYTGGGQKEIVDGYMSTGDTGRFDSEGRLYVEGRDDEMIVSGGENVFPREVEDLLSAHPDIVESAVIGVPDDEFGQRLKAFVVVREGADLDADGVRTHVRKNLARFKIPRDVELVAEIPRNATGKILKTQLS